MIHSRKSLVALILVVVLFSASSGFAQTQQDKATPDKEEVEALREKAFKLLESVAGQLTTLQSAENRARLGANILDSLWKHDEQRARSLLRVVQDDLKTELQKQNRPLEPDPTFDVFIRLRHETVERIAKYDADAAYDLFKVTEPIFPERVPQQWREGEAQMELRLAKQVVANNPEVALKLGRRALERGFSRELLLLMTKLNRKHKQQGQILYKEIVEKFRDADLTQDWNLRYFADTLVQAFKPPDADESTYRELVGILVTKALAKGCGNKSSEDDGGGSVCFWLASIIRPVEQYDSRASRLKHWDVQGDESQRLSLAYEQIEELLQERNLDELEALAKRHPELQEMISIRVVQEARMSGDPERVQKTIDRFVVAPERRQELATQLEEEKKQDTATEANMAEIQKSLQDIPDAKSRAFFLMMNANNVGITDRKASLKLLGQAGEIIEGMKPGKDQAQCRMILSLVYCMEKNDRAFAIMEAMVPKLNELVEIAVKLDGYDTNYLRDGEWNMSSNGPIGELLSNLAHSAGYFAWLDFDRAVSLSSQFERPEIRMMAHVKLAQGILAGPPPRIRGY
jgi:hypothetical protein